KTVSGGYHIYYSCKKIGGSKKLAHETNPNYDPTAEPKTPKYHAVIETKGNGGYALTVPSEGYELVQGSIDRFAYQLTPEERDTLHEICRMLDEKAHDVPQDIPRPKPEPRQYNTSGRYQDW